MQFDFSTADWSDDDSSPFDQCNRSSSSLSLDDANTSTQQRSPITIRFSKAADKVFVIPHVSSMSAEQKRSSWYQPEDYRLFRMQREHETTVARSTTEDEHKNHNDRT